MTMNVNTQPQPGSLFGVPTQTVREFFLPESNGNSVTTTLNSGSSISANLDQYDQTNIIRAHAFYINLAMTFTAGTSETLTQSQLFPYNVISSFQVKFQSAFSTMDLSGIMAFVMQSYRPSLAKKTGPMVASNLGVAASQYSTITTEQTSTNLAVSSGVSDATASINLVLESPESIKFDKYWELDNLGRPLVTNQGMLPALRNIIVSPEYMSGLTRIITPTLQFNQLLGVNNTLNAPVSKAAADTTSTATGTATISTYKIGWYQGNDAAMPAKITPWRYARNQFSVPVSTGNPIINLANDNAGQGQILSLVIYTYDPTLNTGTGGIVPFSDYATVELVVGSEFLLRKDTIATMQYKWLEQHGTLPWAGMIMYDLAINDVGEFTNENAINTLNTAGCQVRITYASGYVPASGSQIFVGVEALKWVS